MGRIADGLRTFFERAEWDIRPGEIPGSFQMGFQGQNGRWTCVAYAAETQEQVVFVSLAPAAAQARNIHAVGEFLHRANWGIHIGNFELDFRDGEIRYKTSLDLEGVEVSYELIRNLVNANLHVFNHYLPGVMGVVQGGMSAEEALSRVEQCPEDEVTLS